MSSIESKIEKSEISTAELIGHFRQKCKTCGHHRIMHNEFGQCEGAVSYTHLTLPTSDLV